MGTWGTAIFSDDLASDVRESWRDLLATGVPAEEATEQIRSTYAVSLADPDQRSVVWLALAVSQWSSGRLLDPVRDAALTVIDDGTDLARWPEGKARAAREKVLATARAQLTGPQRPAGRSTSKQQQQSMSPFSPGDLISYQHRAGPHFVLWVSRQRSDDGGEYSYMDVLDIVGTPPFDLAVVSVRPTMRGWDQFDREKAQELRLLLVDPARLPRARTEIFGNTAQPDDKPGAPRIGVAARHLDDWLRPFLPGSDRVIRRLPPA